jgi:hypothetical protein
MTIRSFPAAAAVILACLQGPLLAQSAPVPDAAATPAPAASPAPSATPAPAPSAAPTDQAGTSDGKAAGAEPAKPKSPKRIKISAQTRQEINHSLKTGTVPSRYRSRIPREYQRYIPFER